MFSRRHAIVLAIAATTLASMTGLSSAQSPGVSEKEIRLGAFSALSGPAAQFGLPVAHGADAYYKMVNDAGGVNGRKIKLIIEDNQFNAEKSVAAVRKLIGSDDVLAIVHGYGTGPSAATLPYVLDEAKVPMLMAYAGSAEWYNPPRPLLFGTQLPLDYGVGEAARWAAQDGHKKVVLLNGDPNPKTSQYAMGVYKSLMPAGTFEIINVKYGTADMAPVALQVSRIGPDAVIPFSTVSDSALMAIALQNQGVEAPIYVAPSNVLDMMFNLVDPDVSARMRGTAYTLPTRDESKAIAEYRDAMAKYYPNDKLEFSSLTAFGQAKVVVEALRTAKEPLTRESLVAAVKGLKNYDSGILPPVTFSEEQHLGVTKLFRVKVEGGKWVTTGAPVDIGGK